MKHALFAAAIGLTAMIGAGHAQAYWVHINGHRHWVQDRIVVVPWHGRHHYAYVPHRHYYRY